MRILDISLRGFRNLAPLSVAFENQSAHFFLGANGHGKTSLLEALGLLTAIRSFRTTDRRSLIAWGECEAVLRYTINHDRQGLTEVTLQLRGGSAVVDVDGERLRNFADFVGLFPTVALSTQDIQLLRAGPAMRRRFLDGSLAAVDPTYFQELRRFHNALVARNSILKDEGSMAALRSFTHQMALSAARLVPMRRAGIIEVNTLFKEVYSLFAGDGEKPSMEYHASIDAETPDDWIVAWDKDLDRDKRRGSTTRGPHRDDVVFRLFEHSADRFASEGQQRSIVTALRLAQAAWFQRRTGERPVLLADDILGEFDPARRQAFWRAIGDELQIFASGTVLPPSGGPHWKQFNVIAGNVHLDTEPPMTAEP